MNKIYLHRNVFLYDRQAMNVTVYATGDQKVLCHRGPVKGHSGRSQCTQVVQQGTPQAQVEAMQAWLLPSATAHFAKPTRPCILLLRLRAAAEAQKTLFIAGVLWVFSNKEFGQSLWCHVTTVARFIRIQRRRQHQQPTMPGIIIIIISRQGVKSQLTCPPRASSNAPDLLGSNTTNHNTNF